MTLNKKMWPQCLNKAVQTAIAISYAANLCNHATCAKITTLNQQQPTKQPCMCKPPIIDISFDAANSPSSSRKTDHKFKNNDHLHFTFDCFCFRNHGNSYPILWLQSRAWPSLKGDWDKPLPTIWIILFQLEQKVDSLVQSHKEQEKVNINVSKQLNCLVENVTKLLKHLVYQLHNNSQSLCSSDEKTQIFSVISQSLMQLRRPTLIQG